MKDNKKSNEKRVANDAIGAGAVATGLGLVAREFGKIGKGSKDAVKTVKRGSKALLIAGPSLVAAGVGYKAYQHYKDKKAKAEGEEIVEGEEKNDNPKD